MAHAKKPGVGSINDHHLNGDIQAALAALGLTATMSVPGVFNLTSTDIDGNTVDVAINLSYPTSGP